MWRRKKGIMKDGKEMKKGKESNWIKKEEKQNGDKDRPEGNE